MASRQRTTRDRSPAGHCGGAWDAPPVSLGEIDEIDESGEADETDAHDGPGALISALDAAAVLRRSTTAEEYRLIHDLLVSARVNPQPWVGGDHTLDGAGNDLRRRAVAAVRRERLDLAERAVVAEIAVRLRLSEHTVRTRARQAEVLLNRCPRLWRLFAAGATSERHAVEAARLAESLPNEARTLSEFDDGASAMAVVLTPAKFAVAARALRERVHAESVETRHRRAAADRGVWLTAELDGMATLTALMPADRAHAVLARVDAMARGLRTGSDEERTLSQLRADVFADLATGAGTPACTTDGSGSLDEDSPRAARSTVPGGTVPGGTVPSIAITVPALTLLGASDEPATLDGYGPIDIDTARRLAGGASSWVRILTHPVTGTTLALDRRTYRVPHALRRWLGLRHPTCAFPGCRRPSRECDMDHLHAWAEGGATDADNLAPECRHHHRIRHGTAWQPRRTPEGVLRWRSPLGREVDCDPPPF